jgi:hypothetical protein
MRIRLLCFSGFHDRFGSLLECRCVVRPVSQRRLNYLFSINNVRINGLVISHICGFTTTATHEILLPLWLHLVSCSRSGRSGGTLPCKMASQPTLETSSTSTVALRWCTVRGWDIGAEALLHALARWLLPVGSRWLLLRPLRLEARTLGLNVRPLCQKLRARHLH